MGELVDFPNIDPKAQLESLEQTNTQLIQKLASMGVGIDGASILALKLDLLVERLVPEDQRVRFEIDFHLKFSEMLQQITREVTFNTRGLVIPK